MSFFGVRVGTEATGIELPEGTEVHLSGVAAPGGQGALYIHQDGEKYCLAVLKNSSQALDHIVTVSDELKFTSSGSVLDLTGFIVEESFGEEGEEEEEEEQQQQQQPVKKKEKKEKKEKKPAQSPAAGEKRKAEAKTESAKKKKKAAEETPNKKSSKQVQIVRMANGLQIQDVRIGTGKELKKGQNVKVRYKGMLENGKVFDSNMPKGKPFQFRLGAGQVIKGWDLGVAGMRGGGRRNLLIPSSLGYGSRGAPPDIPGGATLIFEVEAL